MPLLMEDHPPEQREESPAARKAKIVVLVVLLIGALVGTHFVAVTTPSYWKTVGVMWAILGGFALVIGLVFWALHCFKGSAERELARIYAECGAVRAGEATEAGRTGEGPLVSVRYHTYHGFLNLQYTTEHDARVPPDNAREFLWRLFKFSLKRGLFGAGGAFVPFLGLYNYWRQKSSIERQTTELMGARDQR